MRERPSGSDRGHPTEIGFAPSAKREKKMTHSLKARSPRESDDRDRFEGHVALIESLGEVLASSASPSFEIRMKAWLWLEKHGEAAARALTSASSAAPERLGECDCRQEQPLAVWESDLLALQIQSSPGDLTAREIRVLGASLGLTGPPRPLAKIALELGLTRERVRQIECVALAKLGIRLPKGMHRSPAGRWKRARIVLRHLAGTTSHFREAMRGADPAGSKPREARP
ncbi:MAG: sigma factor-like helix-turn-helix DNA-binding protein [Acidobacteriota bacterium]